MSYPECIHKVDISNLEGPVLLNRSYLSACGKKIHSVLTIRVFHSILNLCRKLYKTCKVSYCKVYVSLQTFSKSFFFTWCLLGIKRFSWIYHLFSLNASMPFRELFITNTSQLIKLKVQDLKAWKRSPSKLVNMCFHIKSFLVKNRTLRKTENINLS